MARPEKVAAVDEIKDKLTSSGATVITEYRGLSVTALAELRAALRGSETTYKVYKNSLARRAVEAAELGELSDLLVGPTAWAFVDGDIVSAAKAIKDFAKTNEALLVKGGLLEGQILTPEQVLEIADLPTREELLAKLAGAFKAPMAKAAGLFSAIQRNTAFAFKALIDKRVEAGEELPAPAAGDSEPGEETPASADSEPAGAEGGGEPNAEASESEDEETSGDDAAGETETTES